MPVLPHLSHLHPMLARLLPSFLRLAASSLFFVSLAAGAAGNAIVIGQAIDLSGPNGSVGRDYVAGIKTCFDMVNSAGGINGRRIHYIVHDDRGQSEAAANAATELIEREQVDYLLGGVGDEAVRAVLGTPAFRRSSHLLYAPLAAAEPAAGARVLFWRPSYRQEIRHIFSHFSKLGIADIGIVYQDTPTNQEAYRSLMAATQEHRMKVTGTARIGTPGEQTGAEAKRLAATKPGFVLVIADTIGTALFLREYRKHDAQTFVAGTSLTNLATLRELAGPAAVEWTVFSQVVPNPSAGTSLLQVEHMNMMRKYRDESISALTLEGFAAAKSLVKAIRQAKPGSRSALQDLIAQNGSIDLGGLSVAPSNNGSRLSAYLDIALFRKGSGLLF
jgi:ABC-type branched-subunit amino acid transport system substrate-binding protein